MKKYLITFIIIIFFYSSCTKSTTQKSTSQTGCNLISYTDHPNGYALQTTTFHYNEQNQIVSIDKYYTYNVEYDGKGKIIKIDQLQGMYHVGTYLVFYYSNAPDIISGYTVLDGNGDPTDTATFQYDGDRLTVDAHTQDGFITTYHFQNPGGNGLDAIYLHYGNVPNNHLDIQYRPYGTDIPNPFYTDSKENQFLLYLFSGEYAYQSNLPTEFEFHDLTDAAKIVSVIRYQYYFDSTKNVIKRLISQALTPPNFTDFTENDENDFTYDCK